MASTTPSDDAGVPCEWDGCNREFGSVNGMKTHHVAAHGESIAGVEVTCAQCGDTKRVPPSQANKTERSFCVQECERQWKSENIHGENHHQWSGRVEVKCAWCGDPKDVIPSIAERNTRHFCNLECSANWRSENIVAEDHPQWDGGKTTVECAYCGMPKEVTPSIATKREHHFCGWDCRGSWQSEHWNGENNPNSNRRVVECAQCGVSKSVPLSVSENRENHYCSRGCYAEWLSENLHGEDHPSYAGGHAWNYGPNWRRQRRRTLERDNEQCVECGLTRDEHFEVYGDDIDVHHKRPLATFPFVDEQYNRDWGAVNALSNLVTCCTGCHGGLDEQARDRHPQEDYPRHIRPEESPTETAQTVLLDFCAES